MKRIMVIGCSGSGKTMLSRKLATSLDLPLVHLDKLKWRDNWSYITKDEFDRLLLNEVMKPEWIIDGNYGRTLPLRLDYCDTVIYLDVPRYICISGVIKRVLINYGKTREDMGGECPEKFDWEFMKFIWTFNKKNRTKYYELLRNAKDRDVIILKSRWQINALLKSIK